MRVDRRQQHAFEEVAAGAEKDDAARVLYAIARKPARNGLVGSPVAGRRPVADAGLSHSSFALDGVAAELIAQCCDRPSR